MHARPSGRCLRTLSDLRVSSMFHPFTAGGPMGEKEKQEQFDTGLGKIKQEIKSRLVAHGLYGSFAHIDARAEHPLDGAGTEMIEIIVKGRRAAAHPFAPEPGQDAAVARGWREKDWSCFTDIDRA